METFYLRTDPLEFVSFCLAVPIILVVGFLLLRSAKRMYFGPYWCEHCRKKFYPGEGVPGEWNGDYMPDSETLCTECFVKEYGEFE
jgi:hypothetical protein